MTLSQTYISRKQLLVDNLVAKGVTGYTVDDGLTTLINAVLEIQGGGGERTLTLTADKSILSYYDSDTATLSATLLEDGEPVTGETVEFWNGSTSLGTSVTNSSGVAEKVYSSSGSGDVELSASVGTLVSETFTLEDCHYYNDTVYTFTTDDGIPLNVPLPSTFSLEYDSIPTTRNYSAPYLDIGRSSNDRILIGQYAKAGTNGIILYTGSQTNKPLSGNSTLNVVNKYVFTFDGSDYTIARDSTSMNVTGVGIHLDKIIHIESGRGGSLSNIKVKPL